MAFAISKKLMTIALCSLVGATLLLWALIYARIWHAMRTIREEAGNSSVAVIAPLEQIVGSWLLWGFLAALTSTLGLSPVVFIRWWL